MTHPRSALRLILAAGAFFMLAASAQAQGTIRYVSAAGNDSNNCTFAAPCRTLQKAVNVVPAGGVVQVLNSAGYGNVGITKSVTISGGGNVVAMGERIRINNASAVVVLRDLVMDGVGTGVTGILISAASAVHIEGCAIERYTGDGILLDGGDTQLFITDSVSRENGYSENGGHGLRVNGEGTTATLTVDNSRFENNLRSGIEQSGGTANVTWTTAANNGSNGYAVFNSGQMTLESSVARGNGSAGLYVADAAGRISSSARISNSVVTNNYYGIYNDGGVLTRENNTVSGNSSADVAGSNPLTPLAGI